MLDGLGIGADARVGTFAWNNARHLELYFAVPCTGRVLHTLNIRLFSDQLSYIVNHAEDEAIFVDRSLLGVLWPLVDGFDTVRHIVVMDDGADVEVPDDPRISDYEALLAAAEPVEFGVDDEDRAAAMCYTSGTTGNPKGVVYSHRSTVLHSMGAMMADSIGVCERDVVLPVVPMFHANAWGLAQAAVFAGATLVLPGPDLSPPAVVELIESERVTLAAGVPTIWMGVLPLLAGRDVGCLTRIVSGGSAVPKALSEAYREAIGLPLLQAWGMTETSPVAIDRPDPRPRWSIAARRSWPTVRSSQGMIVPGVEVRIVGPGGGERVAVGRPGARRAAGQRGRGSPATTTATRGRRSPSPRTVGCAPVTWPPSPPDGYIRLVDRTKDVIKSGGEWISSVELENEIMAHPAVAEAAVIAIPDDKWSERPLACVVVKPGQAVTEDEVIDWLRPRVAKWWLPDAVVFIDEVPKTSVGKFSKKSLRDRFSSNPVAPGGGSVPVAG